MTAATPGPPPRDHHDGQVTPGQAAYEAFEAFISKECAPELAGIPAYAFADISELSVRAWAAAAKAGHAAIAAQQPHVCEPLTVKPSDGAQPAPELAAAMAEARADRDKYRNWLDDFTRTVLDVSDRTGLMRAAASLRKKAGFEP